MSSRVRDFTNRMSDGQQSGDSMLDIRSLASVLWHRRFTFAVLSALIFSLIATLLMLVPERYSAESLLAVDTRPMRSVLDATMPANTTNAFNSGERIDATVVTSEAAILISRATLERVVDELDLTQDPELAPQAAGQAQGPVAMIKSYLTSIKGYLTALLPAGEATPTFSPSKGGSQADYSAEIQRMEVLNAMSNRISVEIPKSSSLISVSYRSTDPVKAATIVNSVVSFYLHDQVEAKRRAVAGTYRGLRDRLGELKQQLELADTAVQDFRNKHNLLMTSGVPALVQRFNELTLSEITASTEAADAADRLQRLRSLRPEDLTSLPASANADMQLLRSLAVQENDIRTQLTGLRSKLGDLHPSVVDLQGQMRSLQARIAQEAGRMIAGLEREVALLSMRLQRITEAKRSTSDEIQRENNLGSELERLIGEAQSKRSTYDAFLASFNRVSVLVDSQVPDIRVVYDAKLPAKPDFPRVLMILLSLPVVLITAASIVLLSHSRSRWKRQTAREFERQYDVPVLGLTPRIGGLNRVPDPCKYLDQRPLSEYAEAIRGVRNALDIQLASRDAKSLAVVSAWPGEGKSTLAVSLAAAWAHAGLRVLLVDCDMRRATLSRLMQQESKVGLTTHLSRGVELPKLIRPSAEGGFDCIMAGAHLGDAIYRFNASALRDLLDSVFCHYDRILLDMPPLLAVSDALVGASTADYVVFVNRWGHTMPDATESALEQLRKLPSQETGVVLTQVNLKRYSKLAGVDRYSFRKAAKLYQDSYR